MKFHGRFMCTLLAVCAGLRSVLLDLCEDHAQCQVLATSATFRQDPCPTTSKYLEVHYKCRPNEFEHLTVCEGEQMEMSCRKSARIAIYSAMFGRAPNGSSPCPPNRPGYIDCQSAETVSEVRTACQGRKRCDLQATEATFGNPCSAGINKYLTVTYTCVPKKILKELRRHRGRAGRKRKKDRKKKKYQDLTTSHEQNAGTTSSNQALSESQSTEVLHTPHKKTPSDGGQILEGQVSTQPHPRGSRPSLSSSNITPSPHHPVKGSKDAYPPLNTDNHPNSGSSLGESSETDNLPHHRLSPERDSLYPDTPSSGREGSSGKDDSYPHRPPSGTDTSSSPYRPSLGSESSSPNRHSSGRDSSSGTDNLSPYRPSADSDSSSPQWNDQGRFSPDGERIAPGRDRPGYSVDGPAGGLSDSSASSGASDASRPSGGSGVNRPAGGSVVHRPTGGTVLNKPSGGFEVDWSSGFNPKRTMSTLGPGLDPGLSPGPTGDPLDSVRDPSVGSASGTNLTVLCVNHTVPSVVRTVSSHGEVPVGIIKDWFSALRFVQTHQEKAILYMVVGVCFGLIMLLLVVLGRVCLQLKRNSHAKLDISEPTHSRNVSRLNHTGLDTPMLDHSDSIDRIEVVRFEPRGTMRSGYHSALHSDSGDRSLCNYYG